MKRALIQLSGVLAVVIVVLVTSAQAPTHQDEPQAPASGVGLETSMSSPRFTIANGGLRLVHAPSQGVGTSRFRLTRISAVPVEVGPVAVSASVAVGRDGLPLIAYRDDHAARLALIKCDNPSCSGPQSPAIVDSAGGQGVSLTLTENGLPVIAYVGYSGLKLATCNNAACTAGITISFVDAVGSLKVSPSVAIGADGLPVIAYRDEAQRHLKIAKCGNATCSAGNLIAVVELAKQVGQPVRIEIGTAGFPVIWYQVAGTEEVKQVACGNASCTAGNTITAALPHS